MAMMPARKKKLSIWTFIPPVTLSPMSLVNALLVLAQEIGRCWKPQLLSIQMTRMSWEDENIGPDVATAGHLVSDYIGRDAGCFDTSSDLEETLEASRYSSHAYSSPPKEWSHPIEVVNARELPQVLVDRYNEAGGEGTALCGIFPGIRRAWASVDNSLFLWQFDKWDGQCPEYSGEEKPICDVGLAKAKPRIFVEAIQYLLVLATPVELIFLGVCCSSSGDGIDLYAELSLQPLPEYTIPSDGVTMTCVACQRKNTAGITRWIKVLSILFEVVKDSTVLLPPSVVLCSNEMYIMLQRTKMFLEERGGGVYDRCGFSYVEHAPQQGEFLQDHVRSVRADCGGQVV